jgi:hypothetical protein
LKKTLELVSKVVDYNIILDIIMIKIDICMTAVLRPKIIDETLDLIIKNVCNNNIDRFTLILNVDPIGENIKPVKIVNIAQKKFKNVIYNITKKPSFPLAVKWVWKQTTAPYIFHWEDDVNILRKIDIDNMIKILEKYKKLSSLRLYKANIPNKLTLLTFNCKWKYNKDGFYLATDWKKQFGLNPILIKKSFIKEGVKLMVDNINPEKQFRYSQKFMRPLIKKWQYGIYAQPGDKRLIDGRKGQRWKNMIHLDKPKGKTFIKWEKK